MIQVSPSIIAADFTRLGEEIEAVVQGGANALHIDVMDGHFVQNISIGPMVVQSIKKITKLPLDVHLMISNPDKYIPNFIRSGADWITVHVEACTHLHKTLMTIKSAGLKAGVALNPGTPLGSIVEVLPMLNFVLIMSVNPGFSGQRFIPSSIDKISRLNSVIMSRRLKTQIAVDGGVNFENASKLTKAGTHILIAGKTIFGTPNPSNAVRELHAAAKVTQPLP